MNIDFSQTFVDWDGNSISEQDVPMATMLSLLNELIPHAPDELQRKVHEVIGKTRPLTLLSVGLNALGTQASNEQNMTGEEKMKRFELALHLKQASIADLDAEQITTLKKLIGERYAPLVSGQAWMMLENKWENGKPKKEKK